MKNAYWFKEESSIDGEPVGKWGVRQIDDNGAPIFGEPIPYSPHCVCDDRQPEEKDAPQTVCTNCGGRVENWIRVSQLQAKAKADGSSIFYG